MPDDRKENKNIHRNHRQKVRERYYASGFKGVASHNILEMLLFFGIPYKDTNPIAHELIDKFGSLSAVLEADVADLKQVKGMTENAACLISMILPIYQRYKQDLITRRPNFNSIDETVEYLRSLYIDNNNIERIFVLCFDADDTLLTYRMVGEGDVSSARFDFRKFASAVLETNASTVIVSHNHPHGIAVPSFEDEQVTIRMASILNAFGVRFSDHIIVADKNYFSMKSSPRYMEHFYNFEPKSRVD